MKKEIIYFLKFSYYNFTNSDVAGKAAQVAFFIVLSIFPMLLFLLSILPAFQIETSILINDINSFFPKNVATTVINLIQHYTTTFDPLTFIVSGILTLFSASSSSNALLKTMDIIYSGKKTNNYFLRRIFGFLITLFLMVSFIFILTSSTLITFFSKHIPSIFILGIVNIITIGLAVTFLILLYKLAPREKVYIKDTLIGVLFVIISVYLFNTLFGIFSNNFDIYSARYGPLSIIILSLFLIYILSNILLLGAIINKYYVHRVRLGVKDGF